MRKLSFDFIKQNIEKDGYILLSKEYNGSANKLDIRCKEGHEFQQSYTNFMNGHKCQKCSKLKQIEQYKIPFEQVKFDIESVEGYKLLSTEYVNTHAKLSIMCPQNHIFEMSRNTFLKGHRCNECMKVIRGQSRKLKIETVRMFFENKGYKLISDKYVNAHTPLLLECEKGHIFEITYANFYNGRRCSVCYSSSGEREINYILNKTNWNFKTQYTFENLVSNLNRVLRFDFAILNSNNEILFLIEYQGQQHYYPVEAFGGNEQFKVVQYNDNLKREFCLNNKVNYLEIPYWKFNDIEQIITDYLKQFA